MGDHNIDFKKPKFSPLRSPVRQEEHKENGVEKKSILSLPDLIEFNAEENPDQIFCLQVESHYGNTEEGSSGGHQYRTCPITFAQLAEAVFSCSLWIQKSLNPLNHDRNQVTRGRKPVALYLESDVGLFIYLAALLSLDIPVWPLSSLSFGFRPGYGG
jgi:hypothetical protein